MAVSLIEGVEADDVEPKTIVDFEKSLHWARKPYKQETKIRESDVKRTKTSSLHHSNVDGHPVVSMVATFLTYETLRQLRTLKAPHPV